MILVEGLSKRYGRAGAPALDGVSFEVGRGEIVGLLGPNGAGKSTMMRILTCFLRPTRGRATLNGSTIADDPRGVRRSVGYLPEAVPLPPEMRVAEYLEFRAALKGVVGRARPAAVSEAIDAVGLSERRAQIVGTLSRGYRQRVGLADALLGRPPILILDEPTVGLDPNQIRETRALIRELGRERTILLSTHILSEVEAVAGRVIILRAGRVVAAETMEALAARVAVARRVIVELPPSERARAEGIFRALAVVGAVEAVDEAHLALTPAAGAAPAGGTDDAGLDGGAVREAIFRAAAGADLALRELRMEAPSLEEIFARATARDGERPA
ncbi:MAG TPA: ABC transporter ATP-binding protein [Polyangia bacterium]|nr:ABC transporter ATP-binding protein [Polyangia bacterium]